MLGRLGHIKLYTGTASTLLEYLFEDASNSDCGFLEDTKEGICRLFKKVFNYIYFSFSSRAKVTSS
jgi:hypothetical protein